MSQGEDSQQGSCFNNSDDTTMKKFKSVLERIDLGNIPVLAFNVRQRTYIQHQVSELGSSNTTQTVPTGCKLREGPITGCYHINFRLGFDDGVEWILKVPANGHPRCFNALAAQALRSEALTMRMLKRETTIPIPTVHAFDNSTENEIGCPYILMDFIEGRSLDRVWFAQGFSPAKVERIRARSLQSIAETITQLNKYRFNEGGALRFDDYGERVVGIEGAKAADNLAVQNFWDSIHSGVMEPNDDDIFCEKGPFTDAFSAMLFMQNRRKPGARHTLHNKGIDLSTRQFTEWIAAQLPDQGQQFVLAHPDFDFQNILVEDDGTVCGFIDWDGVATVPNMVGCQRYPLWLTRDWDAHYVDPSDEEDEDSKYPQNSPEELRCYRAMYAQFIDAALTKQNMDTETRRILVDTTRLSLISATLEAADTRVIYGYEFVEKVYAEIGHLVGDHYDDDSSETSGNQKGGDTDSEGTEATELDNADDLEGSDQVVHCGRCIAEKMPAALLVNALPKVEELHQYEHGKSAILEKPLPPLPDTHDESFTIASRKVKVGKFICRLGETSLRKAANVLHCKKARGAKAGQVSEAADSSQVCGTAQTEPEPPVTAQQRVCRGTRLCKSVEKKLKRAAKILHVDRTKTLELENDKEKKNKDSRVKDFLKWLLAQLEQLLRESKLTRTDGIKTTKDLETQLDQVVELNIEHDLNCPKHRRNIGHSVHDIWNRVVQVLESNEALSVEHESEQRASITEIIRSMKEDPQWTRMAARAAKNTHECPISVADVDDGCGGSAVHCTPKKASGGISPGTNGVPFAVSEDTMPSDEEVIPSEVRGPTADDLADQHSSLTVAYDVPNGSPAIQDLSTNLGDADQLIPRNKACPCGSRRKYKKCCGRDADTAATTEEEVPKETAAQVITKIEDKNFDDTNIPCSPTSHTTLKPGVCETGEYDDGTIDYGGFSIGEICVALGRGNLDEARFTRLKDGFHLLMDQCLGKV
ncbi:hypothetical protein P7C71_g3962, partial [Lecanoromycetidae sp. Uapishka_2]